MSKNSKSDNFVYERINFLVAASRTAAEGGMTDLSQYLGSEADLTAKRLNVRTKPRKTLCKKCHTPLTSKTFDVVVRLPLYTEYQCKNCGTKKKVYNDSKEKTRIEHTIKHVKVVDGKAVDAK